MPPRKKAAKSAGQRSPTSQPKGSGDGSDPDPLPQILAKALAENTDLRNQLLAQLDLVPRGSIQQKDINTQSKESPVVTGKNGKTPAGQSKLQRKKPKAPARKLTSKKRQSQLSPGHASDDETEKVTVNSKKRKTKSTKETSKKSRLIPEALLSSSGSDDSDLDSVKDSDCGRESYVDVDSVLSSDGESDSEPTGLNDLGLLTELLNDEVSDKWKKKIYQQQYVDFNKLYYGRDDHQVHMVVKKNKGNSITSVTKKPPRKITNILSWSRAFQLYASIYCLKYPKESAGMFQYMTLIQTLAKKSPNWQLYDIKFRKLRKHRPLPWAKLHLQAHILLLGQPAQKQREQSK